VPFTCNRGAVATAVQTVPCPWPSNSTFSGLSEHDNWTTSGHSLDSLSHSVRCHVTSHPKHPPALGPCLSSNASALCGTDVNNQYSRGIEACASHSQCQSSFLCLVQLLKIWLRQPGLAWLGLAWLGLAWLVHCGQLTKAYSCWYTTAHTPAHTLQSPLVSSMRCKPL